MGAKLPSLPTGIKCWALLYSDACLSLSVGISSQKHLLPVLTIRVGKNPGLKKKQLGFLGFIFLFYFYFFGGVGFFCCQPC